MTPAPVTPAAVPPASALGEAVRQASELFARGKYAEAEAGFHRALALATTDAERGTLEFNLAACAFELGRYREAEAAFLRSAELEPAAASLARIDAGLAAAKDGRLSAAEAHLAAAGPGDAEVEAQRAELVRELERLRATDVGAEKSDRVREAAAALASGEPERAVLLLERLLAEAPAAPPAELADLHYGLAAAYLALGDLPPARAHVEQAITLEPADPELYVKRAQIELRDGSRAAAARDLERALGLGLTGDTAAWARSVLDDLDPLPSSGPMGSLYVGAGYDTNPAQSGLADSTGVTTATSSGSATLSAFGALGFTGRLGSRAAARLEYSPGWFVLVAPEVRELSLQAHSAAGHLYLAASQRTLFRLTAASTFLMSGLEELVPFTWESGGGARVDFRTGAATRTRLELQAFAVRGFEGQEALGGAREELALLELVDMGDVAVTAGAKLRAVQAGTVERVLTATDLPACGATCEGAVYEIPLSTVAPVGVVDVLWTIVPRFSLGALASVEVRQYLEPSSIEATGAGAGQIRRDSTKTRQDLRLRSGAHAEVVLDSHDHLALAADYTLLVSRSNVAYDPTDAAHALDYDDRQFVQHQVEAGFELRF